MGQTNSNHNHSINHNIVNNNINNNVNNRKFVKLEKQAIHLNYDIENWYNIFRKYTMKTDTTIVVQTNNKKSCGIT